MRLPFAPRTCATSAFVLLALVVPGCSGGKPTVVTSTDGKCQVTVPGGWSTKTNMHKEAQLQVANERKEAYCIVLSESKESLGGKMDYREHSQFTFDNLKASVDGATVVRGPTDMQINGRSAVQYEISGKAQNLAVTYLHTTVDGEHGIHQVLAWSLQSNMESNRKTLEDVIASFKELN